MTVLVVSNVRPWGDPPADVVITDGVVTEVVPAGSAPAGDDRLDGGGSLALPGFVNAHAHVDKSWWGQPWVPAGGAASTRERIAYERGHRERLGIPNVASTTAVLRELLRHGTTAVRTHVDVDLGTGLRGLDRVREAAAALDDAVELTIVAFPQDGVLRRPGVLDLLERAAASGAAGIGGIDPASLDRDPVAQLDGLFAIAERHGTWLDIHLHDRGELGAFQYELIIDRTLATGLRGRVTISHGFALGELPPDRQEQLLDRLAEAGISGTTVAPVRTAPLPWPGLRDRGLPLGLGTDGIRDLWSPYGDGDLLRVALDFARLHGLSTDEDLTRVVELATVGGAPFVHRASHGLVPGARADLVLLDAENVPDALVRAPRRRLVLAGGRPVVRDGEPLAG
ncbi:cytosine deaminase [Actinophytocola xinjiangensis]|uniref:Cytosine deaminase n=1 Tax=Actinophytocola xinjiangensis TaxID=485602 RepID=A0A7Z0WSB0_9PSEU|nr:amidohydrolase [Actinophytocola xinjiangensis]OLF13947.1 cytosine deaminase [Actinophytocola xinjiangensis]